MMSLLGMGRVWSLCHPWGRGERKGGWGWGTRGYKEQGEGGTR